MIHNVSVSRGGLYGQIIHTLLTAVIAYLSLSIQMLLPHGELYMAHTNGPSVGSQMSSPTLPPGHTAQKQCLKSQGATAPQALLRMCAPMVPIGQAARSVGASRDWLKQHACKDEHTSATGEKHGARTGHPAHHAGSVFMPCLCFSSLPWCLFYVPLTSVPESLSCTLHPDPKP